ncbi:non-structural maintenance of chromosomes element 4 homolog A-like isoform X2 [Solanum tuberosum]|uniref:non-structural maintenance of chromosomes element 4 homolog A-like isoform X2 n=1 Tax=Solanum tuberosum TaxID=4113 RepID=UPI00073A0801|nr:PREDICTED: non-structural maintenance of chromosomes element 4 homolog A-like isoform X2 [Solanum tuberosum]
MVRAVKREPVSTPGNGAKTRRNGAAAAEAVAAAVAGPSNSNNNNSSVEEETIIGRRVLRSHYLNFKNRISDERDNISTVDSDRFKSIIEEVERLHQQVQKPREQVADAEALLDITNTLVTTVKAHSNGGVTPSDFVSCLLRDFGQEGGSSRRTEEDGNSVHWYNVGRAVSHVFRGAPGCCTMIGPMNTEIKQRNPVVRKKRVMPTESEHPEELDEPDGEGKTDTDKNMATMFQILRRHKAPRNAPASNAVLSGEVSYNHFVFRFDFQDWKLMLASVAVGDELMPHRNEADIPATSQPASSTVDKEQAVSTTPIRKLSRNRGLVLQEQTVVEDSPESDNSARAAAIRKGKRKLTQD